MKQGARSRSSPARSRTRLGPLPAGGRSPASTSSRVWPATADALGYSVVTISDHVVLPTRSSAPYPYDNPARSPAAPSSRSSSRSRSPPGSSAIPPAGVRVAISVLVVPYRNPVVTAKQLATIDAMSGGRLIVGVGVGWWPEEFEALAAPPFAERGAVTDEYIRLMKTLWTEERSALRGASTTGSATSRCCPKPVQKPHPPIWVGGHTEPALRRTALLGDAWHPIGLRGPAGLAPDELARRWHGSGPSPGRPGATRVRSGWPSGAPRPLAGPRQGRPDEAPRPLAARPTRSWPTSAPTRRPAWTR